MLHLALYLAFSVTAPTASQIDAAAKYSREQLGASFLVMQSGKVLREEYPGLGRTDRAWELASGTKSFNGVMALYAVEDGLLKLDEKASDTITEWKVDRRKDITIRQLLSLVSGIPGGTMGRPPSYSDAIGFKATADPGTRFQYGPAPFMAFGELMRRKLLPKKESVLAYIERRILKPAGAAHGPWKRDSDGNAHLPSGASMTAQDWAKFGEMIRLDGKGMLPPGKTKMLFQTTTVNPSYGLTWWLPSREGLTPGGRTNWKWSDKLPKDVYVAAGAGGQRLYVIPSHELVVVRQAPVRMADDFEDMPFLLALLSK